MMSDESWNNTWATISFILVSAFFIGAYGWKIIPLIILVTLGWVYQGRELIKKK